MKYSMFSLVFALFLLVLWVNETVHAQTISILEEFEYGSLVILDNSQPNGFRIRPNGNPQFDASQFVSLGNPDRARIRLFDFPPNSSFSVSVSATPVLLNGTGPRGFTITDVQIRPNTLATNGNGRDTVRFGSTLETDGDGTPYPNGSYTGSVLITVLF